MKHSYIYLFGALAILASCAKEVEKTEEPVVPAGKEQVTIIAQTPQTRTTATVGETDVDFSWQAEEKIAVVEQDATTAAQFTVSNPETGTFTGNKTTGKELLFAVSPAQDLTTATTAITITSYTITLPATYENYVPGTTNAVMIGTPNGDPQDGAYPFRFAHAAALVKVTYVNVPVGTKKLGFTADKNINGSFTFNTTTGVTLNTPDGDSKTTWLELSEAVITPNQTMEFYIPVPAATYGQFSIALYKVEGNEDVVIAETKKKKSSSTTLAVGDMLVTPTVTLPEVAYYVKVTSAPSDWSGDYLIVYQANDNSTSGEVLTGVTNNVGQHSTVSISHLNSNSKILANRAYNVKIEKSGNSNNYTMKLGSKYLAYTSTSTSSNNYLYAVDNASTNGTLWTLSLDDARNVYNTNRYLRYNTSSPRFCCYTSGQSKITFYKLEDNTVWDLKSIAVTTAPTKTDYEAGETFDPTGMVVTATYEDHDGVKADKTETVALDDPDLTLSPDTETALTAENTAISITYNGQSTTQDITVTKWDLKSIAVTTAPTKTTYDAGECFDPTGMVITATYEDHAGVKADKTETVALDDPNLTLSPGTETALTAENTAITITYNGQSTTQDITVTKWDLKSIAVTHAPTKTTYTAGEKFNPEGLVVTATYEDHAKILADKDVDIANSDLTFTPDVNTALTTENTSITIQFNEKSTSQAITVNPAPAGPSDYSDDYTGNVTLSTTGGTNASDCVVKISNTDYEGIKAGTSNKSGAIAITVPSGTKYLHLHLAGWNSESVTLSVAHTGYSNNISLTANSGISGNTPFYFSGDPSTTDYYKVITFTNPLTSDTELTFSATSGKRFVIWGVTAESLSTGNPAPSNLAPVYDQSWGTLQ